MKYIIFITFIILLSGCSFKTAPNEWQHKSSNAFGSYTQNFLKNNEVLANIDLERAVQHAKKSANLTQLAKIYSGECALNISVGLDDSCSKYTNIQEFIHNKELDAYYSLLTLNVKKADIQYLPMQYREFALNIINKDFTQANHTILTIQKDTSRFLCASLIKETLEKNSKEKIIETASFYGYKKVVLFWLHETLKDTDDLNEIRNIKKKISILESPFSK